LLAHRQLVAQRSPISLRLLVTGTFVSAPEKAAFDRRLAEADHASVVQYLGFVSGEQKDRLLHDADLFCFPTYYENENQPVNLIEAMAFGLPIISTRWRSLPEMFPPHYPGLVDVRSPVQIADAVLHLMHNAAGEQFRQRFLEAFTLDTHLRTLAGALHRAAEPRPAPAPAPAELATR
jgi:glycosyltransferase involved in cell wall biosynthesis